MGCQLSTRKMGGCATEVGRRCSEGNPVDRPEKGGWARIAQEGRRSLGKLDSVYQVPKRAKTLAPLFYFVGLLRILNSAASILSSILWHGQREQSHGQAFRAHNQA